MAHKSATLLCIFLNLLGRSLWRVENFYSVLCVDVARTAPDSCRCHNHPINSVRIAHYEATHQSFQLTARC